MSSTPLLAPKPPSIAAAPPQISYPRLYAPEGHKFFQEFNSIQRAHQNTLETWAPTMLLMLACGLTEPRAAATAGFLWVASRFIYGIGYGLLGPSGRFAGGILSYAGLLPLLWMTGSQGARMANLL